eukprot:COSAG06_NODE_2211_length_7334_cov_4.392122_1_plen_160_part_10
MQNLVTRKPFVNAPKAPGVGGSTDSDTSSWKFAQSAAAGAKVIYVATHTDAGGEPLGGHHIGSTLTSSKMGEANGVDNAFAAGTRVTYVGPELHNKQEVHISAGIATAVDTTAKINATAILVTPLLEYGYGVKAVAEPSLDPSSEWGQVLSADEMRLIAE